MSANAQTVYWPESLEVPEHEDPANTKQRIVHSRHRIGKYLVTRLVLDSGDEPQPVKK
jgi:hypothetical protein